MADNTKTVTIDGQTFFTVQGSVEYINRTPDKNGKIRPITESGISHNVYVIKRLKVARTLGKNILFSQAGLDAFIASRAGPGRRRKNGHVSKSPATELGRQVRAARDERGLSQSALAEKVGVSRQTICGIECGKVNKPRRLGEMVKALDLDPAWASMSEAV